jgi:hypothetical protein
MRGPGSLDWRPYQRPRSSRSCREWVDVEYYIRSCGFGRRLGELALAQAGQDPSLVFENLQSC